MKYNQTILDRVRVLEHKYGIRYATPDGAMFRWLRILYIIVFIYTMGINLLFLAGQLLLIDRFKSNMVPIITVCVCTVVLIASLVLLCLRFHFTGAVSGGLALIFMVLTFSSILKDSLGFFGYKPVFYWRHFIPAAVMLLLLFGMAFISVRARRKTDRLYKKVLENVYQQYHMTVGEEAPPLTDEQWEELLNNYDPRGYKKQFSQNK